MHFYPYLKCVFLSSSVNPGTKQGEGRWQRPAQEDRPPGVGASNLFSWSLILQEILC